MPELQVIARHRMKSGEEDAVLALLPAFIEAARAEPFTDVLLGQIVPRLESRVIEFYDVIDQNGES
jgi:hypothetical protein